MASGFLVTFPSSRGVPCFLVTPSRVGQPEHHWYPWARADFVGTLFATREAAQAALDRMLQIHHYIAPELNGGLTKRLLKAEVVGADQVTGIEFEIP